MSVDVEGAGGRAEGSPFFRIDDLQVQFQTDDGTVRAVDGVSYSVERGKTLAVVGESGSGKSVTANAVMGLLDSRQATVTGSAVLDGEDLVQASTDRLRELRGSRMSMVFQDPLSSLHPFYTIGRQLTEAVQTKRDVDKGEARDRALQMLDRVGIPNAEQRLDEYPHQLSGGMRQRVMIAMALINDPQLLFADEPTTALDVTVQAQIIDLMKDLQDEFDTAIVIITHDLGVVADMADDVVVMYGGRVVERGTAEEVYYRAEMPYTWGLMSSVPRMDLGESERLHPIPGSPPSLLAMPKGCVFRPRCTYHDRVSGGLCDTVRPELLSTADGHDVRCHIPAEERREIAADVLAGIRQPGGTP